MPPEHPVRVASAAPIHADHRLLTREEFQGLAQVPPEFEWFANIQNERTRKAYQNDLHDFMAFVGIEQPEEFRQVTRAHVIAWRNANVSTTRLYDKRQSRPEESPTYKVEY